MRKAFNLNFVLASGYSSQNGGRQYKCGEKTRPDEVVKRGDEGDKLGQWMWPWSHQGNIILVERHGLVRNL